MKLTDASKRRKGASLETLRDQFYDQISVRSLGAKTSGAVFSDFSAQASIMKTIRTRAFYAASSSPASFLRA